MKHIILAVVGVLTVSADAHAQSTAQIIERALAAAPARGREAASVVRWNTDHTYETLKEGTSQLVCYDRSGEPGEAAFAVQCTVLANLDRVAQNRWFDAEGGDRAGIRAMVAEAAESGTRVPAEYGSIWLSMNGPDRAGASTHTTIAVPMATAESTGGLPTSGRGSGAWLMAAGTERAHIMVPGN